VQITTCGREITIPDMYAADFDSEVSIRDEYWHISEGDVVLDIGASVGIYTIPALAHGARVFAVDILNDPETSPLVQIARDNGLDERLVPIQCAVADEIDGEARYPDVLMSVIRTEQPNQWGGLTYPGLRDAQVWTTIDRMVEEHSIDRLDWIKIDTEGGELPILRGARKSLERFHPKLLVEEHSHIPHIRATNNAPALREYLGDLDYGIQERSYLERALWYCVWRGWAS
jgi:FkbM family methyltransferase